jgi:predicted MFS family arabinose efflux permease
VTSTLADRTCLQGTRNRRDIGTTTSRRGAVRRLAASRFISMAGSDATGVAIGFALYAQTGSSRWISLSLILTVTAGVLVSPLAGRAGDLVDRRRLMIACELAAATLFVVLAVVHTPVALLALGVAATVVGTVFGPASGAAIAHVAGDEHLSWANGVIATGANVGKTAGRLAAGALVAGLGTAAVFVLDALTFVVSAWLIYSIRRAFSGRLTGPAPDSAPLAPEPRRAGFRDLARDDTLRPIVLAACVSVFATAFTMTAEIPLVFDLGAGALGLGALTACWGAGMVLGSRHAGAVLHAGNEATGVLVGRVLMAAGVGLAALTPSLAPTLACYLLGGLGGGFMGVAAQGLILRSVHADRRGAVLGVIESCRNVALGLGVVAAGAFVELLGPRPVYALVGAAMALGALPVAMLVRRMGGVRSLRPVSA